MKLRRIAWLGAMLAAAPMFSSADEKTPAKTAPAPAASRPVDAIEVRAFRYEGNTAIRASELDAAVADILRKRFLTLDNLEAAREAITQVYVNRGFANSGAVLPDQDVADGVVTFRIVEGKLGEVNIRGQKLLKRDFIQDRIWSDPARPLNVRTLKDNLELLRENPNINAVNAFLKPGEDPAKANLDVIVTENAPWQLGLSINNSRPPSIGGSRVETFGSWSNITGYGDSISARWTVLEGKLDDFSFADANNIAAGYALPLNSRETTLLLNASRSDSLVIEEPVATLDIASLTEDLSVGLRHPLFRSPNTEFALAATLAWRHNQTQLNGQDFSFSPGVDDGQSTVSVIRLAAEYMTRDAISTLAMRSTLNIGANVFNATVHGDDVPDSQFLSWLLQGQYSRRLFGSDNRLILRFTSQLSDDALLPLEQFSLGGVETVRGYRENQVVRDNAMVASAEIRVPLVRKGGLAILELAPFFDVGYGWNTRVGAIADTQEDELLSSAGVGLIFRPNRNISATVYWGHPFKHFDNPHEDLQDYGIHFNLTALIP